MLTIGSLFSGIGGLELGLEWGLGDGAETIFQVEIEPYCRRVLEKHWPNTLRFEDIHGVGRSNLPRVDILCGGFPCQDLSLAGSGAGLDGSRSGLWREFARVIRELRPRYVVVENVAALLARGLGRVLGDLAESGYDAWWDCIPASSVGAPHRRDRIFIVAYTDVGSIDQRDADDGDGGSLPSQGKLGIVHGSRRGESAVPDSDSAGCRERRGSSTVPASLDPAQRVREAVADTDSAGLSDGDSGTLQGLAESERTAIESERCCRAVDDAVRGRHGTSDTAVRAGRDCALDASWWAVEPDVGGTLDGFSRWLDGRRKMNDAIRDAIAPESVCALWQHVLTQTIQRPLGRCIGISSEAVLLAYVCQQQGWEFDEARLLVACTEALEARVRCVRFDDAAYCPSCRSGRVQQHTGEHPDAVRALSQLLAHASEAAWTEYRRSDAAPVLTWEAGYARVAYGIPARVDRLRGLGNAVVPHVGAVIGRMIRAHAIASGCQVSTVV